MPRSEVHRRGVFHALLRGSARTSLRLRVVLFTLAILLPAFAAAGWVIATNVERSRQAVIARLTETTRALALVVDREIERRASSVQVLAASPQLQNKDLIGFRALATAALQNPRSPVALIDQKSVHFNMQQPDCCLDKPLPLANPAAFSESGVQVSDLFYGSLTGQRLFVVTTPVTIEGHLYNLALGVLPEELQRILDDQRLPPGWAASIVNRQGTVLAWTPDPQRYIGNRASALLNQRVQAEREGNFRSVTPAGLPTHVFFSIQSRFGMGFRLAVPESVLESDADRLLWQGLVTALLLIAAGVGLAVLMGRSAAKPIERLQQAAGDLEAGRPVQFERSDIPEIHAVGVALERASQRIRNSTDILHRRVAEAVARTEAAQQKLAQSQKLEAIGRLTGGVAHDFNNLLQTLATGLHMLQLQRDDPASRPFIDAGQRAVHRAAALVQRLMALGRHTPMTLQTVDLRNLLLSFESLLNAALASGIRLRVEMPADLWAMRTDPSLFEVALLNLVINARDAMEQGGDLVLRARNQTDTRGEWVVVEVVDTGSGIAPENLPRMFEPFFTTKPVGRGTGLGLAQVRDLVEQSGGSVSIDSELGRGTTVRLRMPRAVEPVTAEILDESRPIAAPQRPFRLLFVEDDVLAADVVCSALRGLGFQVVLTRNADEALALLRGGARFDAVFSDVVMPGTIGGLELARLVAVEFPGLPMVLASGYAGPLPEGPRVLVKPYSIQSLTAVLQECTLVDER